MAVSTQQGKVILHPVCRDRVRHFIETRIPSQDGVVADVDSEMPAAYVRPELTFAGEQGLHEYALILVQDRMT